MTSILYTTTAAVRAVLGVTERELEDYQITDLQVATQLEIDLDTVYADHVALKAKIDASTATADEIKVWKRLQMYVQYQAAVMVCTGMQGFLAQKISDGDAEMQRFQDRLQEAIDRITGMRDQYLGLVNPDLIADGGSFAHLSLAAPDRDPVVDA